MYWTPCARLMKSITPNTSVRPGRDQEQQHAELQPVEGLDDEEAGGHGRLFILS